MGKSSGKKKKGGDRSAEQSVKQNKTSENSPRAYDKDTAVFIAASQELKDEGNKLFQRRDSEGAMLKYEKALKLLPKNHIDVAYLRSNMAACYMQMGISDYPRAIHECNLALEVSPKYSKALIKRARCYEGLNRLDLAWRDIDTVLSMEPNNLTALEIAERVKQAIEVRGDDGVYDHPVPEYVDPPCASPPAKAVKEVTKKKKYGSSKGKKTLENKDATKAKDDAKNQEDKEEKHAEDKVVVEEKVNEVEVNVPKKRLKLIFGDDIRWAHLPTDYSLFQLREVIQERFPTSKAVLVKYKDYEGDLVTITNDEELKWAESSAEPQSSVKFYVVEVDPEQDLFYEKIREHDSSMRSEDIVGDRSTIQDKEKGRRSLCVEEWILHFAHLFKNYVGFSSDAYLDLHEIGVKLYSEAMEDVVTSEEAQVLFDMAVERFQDMAALALFNWGNVHMARARKRVHISEESSRESNLAQIKNAYGWAQKEFVKAGQRYEEALRIKPEFYEGYLALAQQQFEQAKLAWYFAVATNDDLETWSSTEVLQLYNCAEGNIEKGMQLWEELEQQHKSRFSEGSNGDAQLHKMVCDPLGEEISADEAAEQAATMRSQINILWGTMLYERSIMEYKLQLPVWHECLEVAIERFELAGVSPTDITVMIKNHCSNDSALEGLGFRIDELVQAWNDMDEARRWYSSVPSFRLEPLLRRRASKIYYALEQA